MFEIVDRQDGEFFVRVEYSSKVISPNRGFGLTYDSRGLTPNELRQIADRIEKMTGSPDLAIITNAPNPMPK